MRQPSISICTWQKEFPHTEGVAVVFDIFRCCTTLYCLGSLAQGPLYVASSLKDVKQEERLKKMRVFSELSQPVDCLERYDNSPQMALTSWPKDTSSLVATTTGTPAMFQARRFRKVIVGSLVNFSYLIKYLGQLNEPITLIPAAFTDSNHVEDEITAQAVATALEGFHNIPQFVEECAARAKERILTTGRVETLSEKIPTGAEDTKIALDIDRFPLLLDLQFTDDLFAKVNTTVKI